METLIANLASRARRVNANGRQYLVAPLSMLVPGVLAGSQGALYYPPAEVESSAAAWSGMPITVGHPTRNGSPVAAASVPADHIGQVKNARIKGGRLVGEGWFDIARTRKADARILAALESGETMELSTGLFTSNEPKHGQHQGRAYQAVARNLRPDHLAILPDQIGACSLLDGCGVFNQARYRRDKAMCESNDLNDELDQYFPDDDITANETAEDLAFPVPLWNWSEIAAENAGPQSKRRREGSRPTREQPVRNVTDDDDEPGPGFIPID